MQFSNNGLLWSLRTLLPRFRFPLPKKSRSFRRARGWGRPGVLQRPLKVLVPPLHSLLRKAHLTRMPFVTIASEHCKLPSAMSWALRRRRGTAFPILVYECRKGVLLSVPAKVHGPAIKSYSISAFLNELDHYTLSWTPSCTSQSSASQLVGLSPSHTPRGSSIPGSHSFPAPCAVSVCSFLCPRYLLFPSPSFCHLCWLELPQQFRPAFLWSLLHIHTTL